MSYVQRETPVLAQLCELLVEDQYGELAARVFSVLARFGRQTLSALARASYLNSRQIKHGLVVLVQQHLIFHSGPLDALSSSSHPQPTYYEINWQQSYGLVRYGRILKSVEERFGQKASNVVANLVTLGHTRFHDLKEAYFPTDNDSGNESDDEPNDGMPLGRTKTNGLNGSVSRIAQETEAAKLAAEILPNGAAKTNGTANADSSQMPKANGLKRRRPDTLEDATQHSSEQDSRSIRSVAELESVIHHLMQHGWIIKVDDTQYLSPGDFHDSARHYVIATDLAGRQPTGNKERAQVMATTLQRKRAIRDEWASVPNFRKRRATDAELSRSNKRLRTGEAEWSAAPDEGVVLDGDLIIRVNPEKVAVAMRSSALVHLAEQRLGYVTSKVYEAMLRTLEKNIGRCFEEWPDPPVVDPSADIDHEMGNRVLVTAREVAKKIDPTIDVLEGLDPHAIVYLTHSTSRVDKQGRINPPINPFDLSLDVKTKIVDKHLKALSDDPFHFATWHSRSGYSEWYVEFAEIAKAMIQQEIENTVAAGAESDKKFGVKLIRALRKKGRLDERQMSNAMMMPAGDIRSVVNALTVRGFVQTQEIPKVERREAKHSLHLVWFDCQRAREKLLHDTYKGMIRILQRIAFEKERVQELLSKAERSDVVGNEEKWLSQGELDALKRWKGVQGKLLLQLLREDELVATLRDFTGPLTSA